MITALVAFNELWYVPLLLLFNSNCFLTFLRFLLWVMNYLHPICWVTQSVPTSCNIYFKYLDILLTCFWSQIQIYYLCGQIALSQFSSVAQSCPTPCDPMVNHQLPEPPQTHIHHVSDSIQPSHPLSFPSPPDFNLSQHPGIYKWVSSSYQVAKVLELQLQHQAFQWISRADLL